MAERYCSNCGQELGEGARSCYNCGRLVSGTAREERAASAAGDDLPATFTNSALVEFHPRTTVWVYADRLRVTRAYPLRRQETTLSYTQIARVNMSPGLFFSDLRIETTGGADVLAKALPKYQAEQAYNLINERL